jgi:prevent-host-death family protein
MTRIRHIAVSKAKANLPDLVRSVEDAGDEIVITRHGKSVAVITNKSSTTQTSDNSAWVESLRRLQAEACQP